MDAPDITTVDEQVLVDELKRRGWRFNDVKIPHDLHGPKIPYRYCRQLTTSEDRSE